MSSYKGKSIKNRRATGTITITYKVSEDRSRVAFTSVEMSNYVITNDTGEPILTVDLYYHFTGILMEMYHNFVQEFEPLE